jgi:hypothetical protein
MADKLDKDDWTGFVKKHKLELDDKVLVKALAALDKAGDDKPDERARALSDVADEIKKMVPALAKRKKELGDKPFGLAKDKLYALLDLAEKGHKAALDAAAEAKQKAAKDAKGSKGDDDEDDDSPAVLTTKLIPLIRQLKKGELRLPAMIGSISKTAAVLISKRSISNAKRKLLNEALDAAGGVKYAKGECYYETGTLHFVMSEGKIGGLAKRVRAALLTQTGLRLKVKLRGEDGEDIDGEEEAEEATGATTATGTPAAPGVQAAEAGAAGTTGRPAPPGGPASAEQLAYVQRLRKVRDAYDAALKAQHPESTKLRALMGFASEKAAAKDFAGASKALDMVGKLLGAEGAGPSTPTPTAAPGQPRGIVPSAVYEQSGLVWVSARRKVGTELNKLEAAIVQTYADPALVAEVKRSVRKLDRVLEMFDEQIADSLSAAARSQDVDSTLRLHAQAREAIARYQGYLENDPLVQELDDNPFAPVAVRSTLSMTLNTLASKLV